VLIQSVDDLSHTFHLTRGRLLCAEGGRPLPSQIQLLADRLEAQVFTGDSPATS
jgi:hypothetical protein